MMLAGIGVDLLRSAGALDRMHDDQLGLGRSQIGVDRGIGEALDVVQIRNLLLQRPKLGFGREAVDGKLPALFLGGQDDGGEAAISTSGGTGSELGLLDAGAHIERVRTFCDELFSPGRGRFGSRKRPPSENESSVMFRMPRERGAASASP